MLKREMEEKQLKGNQIEIARSLHAKFNVKSAKDGTKANDHPQEILTILEKR